MASTPKTQQASTLTFTSTPPQARQDVRHQTHHNTTLSDAYSWLKADFDETDQLPSEIMDHLQAENDYFNKFMHQHKDQQEQLYREIKARIPDQESAVPWTKNGYQYRWRYAAGEQYQIWERAQLSETQNDSEIVFKTYFNESVEAQHASYFDLASLAISHNNLYLVYAVDSQGDEHYSIKLRSLETNKDCDWSIENTNGTVIWSASDQGFFYTALNEEARPYQVRYYNINTSSDTLIYEESDPAFFIDMSETQSEAFVIIETGSHVQNESWMIPSSKPLTPPQLICARQHQHLYFIDHAHQQFYIRSNHQAINFRILIAPEENPSFSHWVEWLPATADNEKNQTASATHLAAPLTDRYYLEHLAFEQYIVIQLRQAGQDHILLFTPPKYDETLTLSPTQKQDIFLTARYVDFPEKLYTVDIDDNPEFAQQHLRVSYESMLKPCSIYDYDINKHQLHLRKQDPYPKDFQANDYHSERLWATARDGTSIPISIIYPKDFPLDGSGHLHLYGYGAYGDGLSPDFSELRVSLLKRGIAYAIAHVRGGNELGEQWYQAGKQTQRQNTFNDFVDVANFLIKSGYSKAGALSASGGSAGGELVATAILQAPQLWCGAMLDVPFVDVLNTMLDENLPLTPLEWPEWGNPLDSSEDFLNILSYCPYYNISAQHYPPLLVRGGLHDSRVTYWEPAKWVAKIREHKTDNNILIFKTEMSAGHGGKSGRYEQLNDAAENCLFLLLCHQKTV